MRALRRFFSVLLGLVAGAAALKILSDYGQDGQDGHIEGEYVVLPEPDEEPGGSAPDEAAGQP